MLGFKYIDMLKSKIKIPLLFCIGILCPILMVGISIHVFDNSGPLKKETDFNIHYGKTVRQIAQNLYQHNIINYPLLFEFTVRAQSLYKQTKQYSLKAGYYRFSPTVSMSDVITKLQQYQVDQFALTILEGTSNYEIEKLINAHPKLSGNPITINPSAYILPETWLFVTNTSRANAIDRMQQAGSRQLKLLWQQRAENLPFENAQEALILASIVEREGKKADELATIAGVFINRIHKKMRLQSDPTVLFALTNGSYNLQRKLTRNDTKFKSPFNTYVIKGIPPEPISNPGLAALKAVLQPNKTEALYFVASGLNGTHRFAKTLTEHNHNVRLYKEALKKK